MSNSQTKFEGAKYYDSFFEMYMDELPDGYHEESDGVYLESGGDRILSESIQLIEIKESK